MIGWLLRLIGRPSPTPRGSGALIAEMRQRREEVERQTATLRQGRADGASRSPIGNRIGDRGGGS